MINLFKNSNCTKALRTALLLLVSISIGWGQSSLTAGDIAIIGFNFDNPDELGFVALVDLESGTVIKFTDNGWLSSGSFRSGEGTHTWTAASAYTAGDVVLVTLSGPALSASGDQIIAYQGDSSSPTIVFALNSEATGWQADATNSNTSALPTGLTNGTDAIALNEVDNGYYSGSTSGTKSDLQTAICNTSNWTTNNSRIDNSNWVSSITVSGGGTVDNPTSLSASAQSSSQIDLSWTDNTDGDNVLLAWNSSSTFGTPTNGQTYSADDAISGGGTVLQYSGTDSYSHSSLTGNTQYYYKAWSYDGSTYSSGATVNATTLKIEPTNHPTSLSASSSYQSIEVTWTDAATGSQAPDGYLILGETDASITDPSDGTAVSDDTDAAGNAVAKNITHGSGGSYTFNSLTASTTWYFEIFSYTNSGSDIDYKLDETIQTANATTGVAPVFVINEIHADPDATSGDANGDASISSTDDEFVEIVNRSGYSVDISNWVISDGYGDRHVVTNGTTIGDGVSLVVFGGGTPTNIPGISQTASTGALGLNNSGDDVTLKDSEGGTIVTYSYGSEGGDNQSIARNPDYTGDFVKHSTITGNAVLFSPGKTNAGDVSLPVDLSYFTASSARSDEITLNWVTESELENLGFIVERRNTNVESLWGVIADYMSHPELQGQGSVTHRTEYTFTDNTVEVDQTYDYRLADVSFEGIKEYHTLYVLDVSPVSTPSNFWVQQNFPNPFNPVTTIEYDLPEDSNLKLAIYDILGREVIELSNGYQEAGYKSIQWNGRNTSGQLVSAGMYFYAIEAGKHSAIRKMVLLK